MGSNANIIILLICQYVNTKCTIHKSNIMSPESDKYTGKPLRQRKHSYRIKNKIRAVGTIMLHYLYVPLSISFWA